MDNPQLHHSARRIVSNSLEILIEMFALLGCKLMYREGVARWAMIGQEGLGFNIQLVEVEEKPIRTHSRISSHVAFISNNPKEIIQKIEKWASEHQINFQKGGWNEKELWFDFPDLFVDFVIEVMDRSVVE